MLIKFNISFKDGTAVEATLVGKERNKDIAVLKLATLPKTPGEPFGLADSSKLQVGQKTIAIGSPFGLDQTVTTGIVSATGRAIPGIGGVSIRDMIQTDASINPGNSGGPLLDSRGYLIGMNTMIYSQSGTSAGVGFAVPSNTIERIVRQLIRYGRVRQPGIGVSAFPDEVTSRIGVEGVIIMEVLPGGPAGSSWTQGY